MMNVGLRRPQYTIFHDGTPKYSFFYRDVYHLSEDELLKKLVNKFYEINKNGIFYFDMKVRCTNIPIKHSEWFETMVGELWYENNIKSNIKTLRI